MKYKKSIIMIILAVFLITIAAASAGDVNDAVMASEDTLEIELTHDSGIEENTVAAESEEQKLTTDYSVDGDNFESIQTKINQASAGDRIFLGGKNYTGTGQGILVDKSITIIGGSDENDNTYATLDAQELSRIMKITAKNVVLKGIIFTKGEADWDEQEEAKYCGGAIKGDAHVVNCIFKDNHAGSEGGAMFGGSAVNCTFINNHAGNMEGAMYGYSAVNCTFINNHADDKGGAMSGDTAINCTFTNNTASMYGGAIYFWYYGEVTNCYFEDNSASQGGAIFSNWQYTTADTCIFKTSSDTNTNTVILPPTLNVDNFTTVYGSGEKLTFDLKTNSGVPVTNGNISISVYFKNNDNFVGNYSCLSGEGWSIDLPVGFYYAIFDTEYAEFQPINRTITVTTDGTTFWDLNKTINGNANDIITLDKNYTFNPDTDGEFKNGIFIYKAITINGNGSTIDAKHFSRIFVLNSKDITIANITFVNGNYSDDFGGAIYGSGDNCNVSNCTFKNCNAKGGGAIAWMGNGVSISRSTFVNNSGSEGGAIYWLVLNGNVTGCIFLNNNASQGSAFYNCNIWNLNTRFNNNILLNNKNNAIYSIDASDSDFDFNWFGNNATDYMSQPPSLAGISDVWLFLNATSDPNTIEVLSSTSIVFKLYPHNASLPTYDNALLMPIELTITSKNGKLNTSHVRLEEKVKYSATTAGKGRITATIANVVCTIELDILKADSTLTVNDNITFDYGCAGSTTLSFTNASAVIAEVIGQPNAVVSVKNNTITVSGLNAGNYTLSITTVTDNNHNNVTKNATITVNRAKTELSADDITATYNINRDLIITLKDSNGNPVSGASVSVDLNGVKKYVSDANGQVKVSTKGLAPKTYTAKITFNGDSNYNKTSKDVKVTVIKATPKIIAKKKTYKVNSAKKFKITLKDNTGKPIKNAKVRLIVKKIAKKTKKTGKKTTKKYKKNIKKTNKKGKATFKVKRNKKGKYQAIIKYYGNKCFKAITKKVKITIK